MSCPLRICHPISESRSRMRPKAPQLRPASRAIKKRSITEGARNWNQLEPWAGPVLDSVVGDLVTKASARDQPIILTDASTIAAHLHVIGQIPQANPHVVQPVIGEAGSDRQSKRGVDQSKGKDVAIAAKHLAEKQRAEQAEHRQ